MTKQAKRIPLFHCNQPCGNCPYREDAPVAHWHISEFEKVLASEASELGSVFNCHKNNGGVCVGWLMDQVRREFPSIMLRLALSRHDVQPEYIESLHCAAPMYPNVRAMILANFPELIEEGAGDAD